MKEAWAKLTSGGTLCLPAKNAVICVEGNDAQDFLTRLSTNDLQKIGLNSVIQTSFTTSKGRLVDHCLAFSPAPKRIVLISSHYDPKILYDWLDHYHFVEEVNIEEYPSTNFFHLISCTEKIDETPLYWSTCLADQMRLNFFFSHMPSAHATIIDDDIWDTLRIMALLPRSPNEISEDFMPQNVNLMSFICESKGCYIGQEVIAKAMTYQRHAKFLCGVHVDEEVFRSVSVGSVIANSLGQHGQITSLAPHFVADQVNLLVMSDLEAKSKLDPRAIIVPENFIAKK